jgi:hypothetical protein
MESGHRPESRRGGVATAVIIGHGGFDVGSFEILVPPGTSIKFFADAGSNLLLPSIRTVNDGQPLEEGKNSRFDYAKVASIYKFFDQKNQPLGGGDVSYNMSIEPVGIESQEVAIELHKAGKWEADEIYLKPDGAEWKLCEGDPSKCPTPKLNVAASRHTELAGKGEAAVKAFREWVNGGATGNLPEEITDFAPRLADVPREMYDLVADGVPDDRWYHHCEGILGPKWGQGKQLYWVSCAGFAAHPDDVDDIFGAESGGEVPGVIGTDTAGPGSAAATWTPDDANLDSVTAKNRDNVKAAGDNEVVSVLSGGTLTLIGLGHGARELSYVRRQADFEEGSLKVKKGGAFSKGKVSVMGISGKQTLVKTMVESFSDKSVEFE